MRATAPPAPAHPPLKPRAPVLCKIKDRPIHRFGIDLKTNDRRGVSQYVLDLHRTLGNTCKHCRGALQIIQN